MRKTQEFTPKYWVVHDKNSDDVLLYTASKSRDYSICLYVESFVNAEDERGNLRYGIFDDDDSVECSLVEIKFVEDL